MRENEQEENIADVSSDTPMLWDQTLHTCFHRWQQSCMAVSFYKSLLGKRSHLCLCSSCPPCPCITTCPEACFPSLGASMWGMSTSSKPRSKRLCLELSGRKKKAPKHRVMKALRMRRRINFSESLNVALWCGKEEVPGDRVGILLPDSGRRAGVVMFGLLDLTSPGEGVRGQSGVGGCWCSQAPQVLL